MRIPTATVQSIGTPTIKRVGELELRITALAPPKHQHSHLAAVSEQGARAQRHQPTIARNLTSSAPLRSSTQGHAPKPMPWFAASVGLAAPFVSPAFQARLPQALAVMAATRLAPLLVPAAALTGLLFPRQLGDSSLYVPVSPSARSPADGYRPLAHDDPARSGTAPTKHTRPQTPSIRTLPVTHTPKPALLEGGPAVERAPLPGKAEMPGHWSDQWLLAHEVRRDAPPTRLQAKQALRFRDVAIRVHETEVQSFNGPLLLSDKQLDLTFETDKHGKGKIAVHQPEPLYRGAVHASLEKPAQLSNREAGEILAHALGYTESFVPQRALQLSVKDGETGRLAEPGAVDEIAQWALAMHGKEVSARTPLPSGGAQYSVIPGFRVRSDAFESPVTLSGLASDGPGLAEPKTLPNLHSSGAQRAQDAFSGPDKLLPPEVFQAEGLMAAFRAQDQALPQEVLFNYVIPAPHSSNASPQAALVSTSLFHDEIVQDRDASAAGVGHFVYDPHWGPNGGYRTQVLFDKFGTFEAWGTRVKKETEAVFQRAGLDGDGRWLSTRKPVSTAPFPGLQVARYPGAAHLPAQYEVRIPDARAIEHRGAMPVQTTQTYPDIARFVIEPIQGQADGQPRARLREIQMAEGMWPFASTLLGQALAAVRLTHPATGAVQHFHGLQISSSLMQARKGNLHQDDLIDGLTIYGLDAQLGAYSPVVDFVLVRNTPVDEIELAINPAVIVAP